MHHRNIAYLIADSAHGRILLWDRDAEGYKTAAEIHDGVATPSSRRANGADTPDVVRKRVRAAFAQVLAEHVRQFAATHPVEGFILSAPARLLGPLKAELAQGPPILGAVAKDLTKHDDHDLHSVLVLAESHALGA